MVDLLALFEIKVLLCGTLDTMSMLKTLSGQVAETARVNVE
jgi:hypothetical protein